MRPGFEPELLTRRLSLAGLALVFVIVTASAYLRLGNAGLGCPEWPDCYGKVEANAAEREGSLTAVAVVRGAHRVAAIGAGALVLALVWISFARGPRARGAQRAALMLLMLTVFLAILGRFTPSAQWPFVTLGNLLGGAAMLALLLGLAMANTPAPAGSSALRVWSRLTLAAAVAQISVGALVSAKFAALACPSLTGCGGEPGAMVWSWAAVDPFQRLAVSAAGAIEPGAGAAALHAAHRLWGLGLMAAAVGLGVALTRVPALRAWGLLVVGAAVLQPALGAMAVGFDLPLALAVLHNTGANLLLLALVAAVIKTRSPGAPSPLLETNQGTG